jgi:peptidoglycan-N-acetylglucosamine deacetylase
MKAKPVAGLSMDMDNQWSYMKTHGDDGWDLYPSYFGILVPRVCDLLDELQLSITFFLVGADVRIRENQPLIRELVDHRHELGNHSLHHEPWLHLMPKKRIAEEILTTHNAICDVTGQSPTGFRGPGFSWSMHLLEVLLEAGYRYDASSLPTFIGPLARLFYFWKSSLSGEERKQRSKLFGTVEDGLRSIKPYYWKLNEQEKLLELPVTTAPIVKVPFHLSYLIYLSRFSSNLMEKYLKVVVMLCELTGTPVSFLLHPLDVLGGDEIDALKFFPGMDVSGEMKCKNFQIVLKILSRHFNLVSMSRYAENVATCCNIKTTVVK